MKAGKRQCKHIKADGERCQAAALFDSAFCFFHDPDTTSERQEASARGGYNGRIRVLPENCPNAEVQSAADIVRLLGETINQVRKGDLDPRIANAVGYLANVALRAIEGGDIEKRLTGLEAAVTQNRQVNLFPIEAFNKFDQGIGE